MAAPTRLPDFMTTLGLSVEGSEARVRFVRPALPRTLEHLTIRNLRVGAGRVDVVLRRHPEDVGIRVIGRRGHVEIVSIK